MYLHKFFFSKIGEFHQNQTIKSSKLNLFKIERSRKKQSVVTVILLLFLSTLHYPKYIILIIARKKIYRLAKLRESYEKKY